MNPTTGAETDSPSSTSPDDQPSFSPNSKTIVFRSNNDIWTMTATGAKRKLTPDQNTLGEPAWSPNSTYLQFTSTRSVSNLNILRRTATRTAVTQVADVYPSGSYDPT